MANVFRKLLVHFGMRHVDAMAELKNLRHNHYARGQTPPLMSKLDENGKIFVSVFVTALNLYFKDLVVLPVTEITENHAMALLDDNADVGRVLR